MRTAFNYIHRYFVKKLKDVPRESWVEQGEGAYVPFNQRNIDLEIKYFQDIKKQSKAKPSSKPKQQSQSAETEPQQSEAAQPQVQTKVEFQPRPMSPKLGPYRVHNPKIHDKMYRWCSCGQSLNQPFCDDSHKGTAFKPYKFTIEQNVKQVNLCGCKLTTKKPFCDGHSCQCK